MVYHLQGGLIKNYFMNGLITTFWSMHQVHAPLLLLLDGHSSHFSPEFVRLACEKGVIVFYLPPHLTHFLQPLDSCCFSTLKTYWDAACDKFMSSHPGRIVTVYQFSKLFSEAWAQAMTPSTIIGCFKNTARCVPHQQTCCHLAW